MASVTSSHLNIANYFLEDRIGEGLGNRVAVHTLDQDFTYAEISAMSSRFAHLLREAGIQRQDRVVLVLPDGITFVAAYFGALKLGAVVVMVNPGLGGEQLKALVEHCEPSAVVAQPDAIADGIASVSDCVGPDRLLLVGSTNLTTRLEAAPDTFEVVATDAEDPAVWLFSGGTTGLPKAVVQPHRSFVHSTECYAKNVVGYCGTDRVLSVPKLHFGYAMGSTMLFPFAVGGAAILFPERSTPQTLFAMIDRFKPTLLIGVPTLYNKLLAHPGAKEQDLRSLRLATSAGEALSPSIHAAWKEAYGIELLDGLGTAEMWHIFLTNHPGRVRVGTLGTVVDGFEIKVCDETGGEVPSGTTGHLWVRGNAEALGYWNDTDKTALAFRDGWYISGDLVQADADGYYTYSGRADDMLKVSGQWVSIREVEECLMTHPKVTEAAVVGVVETSGLTKPYAFVIADHLADSLEHELQAYVRAKLLPHKYPRHIQFRTTFPRTHLGKVDRGQLRREAEANSK